MGSKGGSQPQQTTSSNSPPPQVMAEYQALVNRATNAANQPYQQYPGELVAPLSYQTQAGLGGVNQYANTAQPYMQAAAAGTMGAATPVTPQQFSGQAVGQYMNPFTQSVVDTTQAEFNNQNQQAAQFLNSQNIGAGAFGGDRAGVSQSILANQQQLAQSPVIAGLNQANYTQALGEFNNQQATNLAAQQFNNQQLGQMSAQLGSIGNSAQQAGLQGAQAQIQAGMIPQQEQQAIDTALQNQWNQQQSYPFQTTGWLGNIIEGTGSLSGGTSQTTSPGPSTTSQALGAATSGIGLLGNLLSLSDVRAKEDIEPIGRTFDGQNIYRFRYKGDPRTNIGLLAQETEHHEPGAVKYAGLGGLKGIDLHAATEDAASRGHFQAGGAAAPGQRGFGPSGQWNPAAALASMGVQSANTGANRFAGMQMGMTPGGGMLFGGRRPGYQGGGGLELEGSQEAAVSPWSPGMQLEPNAGVADALFGAESAGSKNPFYGVDLGQTTAIGTLPMNELESQYTEQPGAAVNYPSIDFQHPGSNFQTAGAENSLAGLIARPGIETPVTQTAPPQSAAPTTQPNSGMGDMQQWALNNQMLQSMEPQAPNTFDRGGGGGGGVPMDKIISMMDQNNAMYGVGGPGKGTFEAADQENRALASGAGGGGQSSLINAIASGGKARGGRIGYQDGGDTDDDRMGYSVTENPITDAVSGAIHNIRGFFGGGDDVPIGNTPIGGGEGMRMEGPRSGPPDNPLPDNVNVGDIDLSQLYPPAASNIPIGGGEGMRMEAPTGTPADSAVASARAPISPATHAIVPHPVTGRPVAVPRAALARAAAPQAQAQGAPPFAIPIQYNAGGVGQGGRNAPIYTALNLGGDRPAAPVEHPAVTIARHIARQRAAGSAPAVVAPRAARAPAVAQAGPALQDPRQMGPFPPAYIPNPNTGGLDILENRPARIDPKRMGPFPRRRPPMGPFPPGSPYFIGSAANRGVISPADVGAPAVQFRGGGRVGFQAGGVLDDPRFSYYTPTTGNARAATYHPPVVQEHPAVTAARRIIQQRQAPAVRPAPAPVARAPAMHIPIGGGPGNVMEAPTGTTGGPSIQMPLMGGGGYYPQAPTAPTAPTSSDSGGGGILDRIGKFFVSPANAAEVTSTPQGVEPVDEDWQSKPYGGHSTNYGPPVDDSGAPLPPDNRWRGGRAGFQAGGSLGEGSLLSLANPFALMELQPANIVPTDQGGGVRGPGPGQAHSEAPKPPTSGPGSPGDNPIGDLGKAIGGLKGKIPGLGGGAGDSSGGLGSNFGMSGADQAQLQSMDLSDVPTLTDADFAGLTDADVMGLRRGGSVRPRFQGGGGMLGASPFANALEQTPSGQGLTGPADGFGSLFSGGGRSGFADGGDAPSQFDLAMTGKGDLPGPAPAPSSSDFATDIPTDRGKTTPAQRAEFIRSYVASKYPGADPNVALGVAKAEGLGVGGLGPSSVDVEGGRPFSYGDFQMNIHPGALGDQARRAGVDPTNPNQWQGVDKFAIDQMYGGKGGLNLAPWKGDAYASAYLRSGKAPNVNVADLPARNAMPVSATAPGGGSSLPSGGLISDDDYRGMLHAAMTAYQQGGAGATPPSHRADPWTALMVAGGAMMGGTSPYAAVNIGKGIQAGAEYYGKERDLERQWELTDAQVRNMNIEQLEKGADVALRAKQMDYELGLMKYKMDAASEAEGGGGGAPAGPAPASAAPAPGGPTIGKGPGAPTGAPGASPAAAAPSGAAKGPAPADGAPAAPGGPSAPTGPGATPKPGEAPPSEPSAAVTDPTSLMPGPSDPIWQKVAPGFRYWDLINAARKMAPVDPAAAEGFNKRAQDIVNSGMAGAVPLQGIIDWKRGQEQIGEEQKSQGPIYQKYLENREKFETNYDTQVSRLKELSNIYAHWQAGRPSEALAELDSWAKGLGISLPKHGTDAAGFDSAFKSAVQMSFETVADSGMSRAPRTGFREAMATSPKPTSDPAALRKIVTDSLANLRYNHDLYQTVGSKTLNVNDALDKFTASHKIDDYVKQARKEIPMFKGITEEGLNTATGESMFPDKPAGLPQGSLWSPSRRQWRDPSGKVYDEDGSPV